MTTKELIEYLSGFKSDEKVGIMAVKVEEGQGYHVSGYQLISDAGFPVILFEIGQPYPLDEILEEDGGDK